MHHNPSDEYLTARRALARSLLDEALSLPPFGGAPAAPLPREPSGNGRRIVWTPDHICLAIQAFVAQYGEPPRGVHWRTATAYGLPGRATATLVYGSPEAAIRAAGFTPPPSERRPPRRILWDTKEAQHPALKEKGDYV